MSDPNPPVTPEMMQMIDAEPGPADVAPVEVIDHE